METIFNATAGLTIILRKLQTRTSGNVGFLPWYNYAKVSTCGKYPACLSLCIVICNIGTHYEMTKAAVFPEENIINTGSFISQRNGTFFFSSDVRVMLR